MDPITYPLQSFAVFANNQYEAQLAQWKRDELQRGIKFQGEKNIWNMKNDQYDINTRENVRKSTVAGAAT